MKYKMLVTDDDPELLALYKSLFNCNYDLEVDFASTPEECRMLIKRNLYDLVLLDIYLTPGNPDGKDILSEMWKYPHTEAVMMSTCDDPKTVKECFELGADEFISKNDQFISSLQRCIAKRMSDTVARTLCYADVVNF